MANFRYVANFRFLTLYSDGTRCSVEVILQNMSQNFGKLAIRDESLDTLFTCVQAEYCYCLLLRLKCTSLFLFLIFFLP